jgi:hypothetical protein
VVLALLAMAVLMILPRLPDTGEASLRSSARALASTIRYLKDQGAVTRTRHRIRLTAGEGRIAVTSVQPGGAEENPKDPFLARPILAEGIVVSDLQVPRLGKVTRGEAIIDVGAGGTFDVAVIHLRAPEGKQMTVTVLPQGGAVKVEDGYREMLP